MDDQVPESRYHGPFHLTCPRNPQTDKEPLEAKYK